MAVTLRHLKKVRAAYYPFDDAARSCKEFLRRVSCETVRSTNPKCEIQAEVMQDPRAAQLALTFIDGTTQTFEAEHFNMRHFSHVLAAKAKILIPPDAAAKPEKAKGGPAKKSAK